MTMASSEVIYEEADIALLAVGSMVKTAEKVRRYSEGYRVITVRLSMSVS